MTKIEIWGIEYAPLVATDNLGDYHPAAKLFASNIVAGKQPIGDVAGRIFADKLEAIAIDLGARPSTHVFGKLGDIESRRMHSISPTFLTSPTAGSSTR